MRVCGGIGTDIVSVARIGRLVGQSGTSFLERWFTAVEIEYCSGKAEPSRHYAARMAAKEAVLKALEIRWDGGLPWRSIEIVNDRRGVPGVRLSGAFAKAAEAAGVLGIKISLAHCDEYATATALVSTREPSGGRGHGM